MPTKKSFGDKIFALQWLWGPLGICLSIVVGVSLFVIIFWKIIVMPGTPPGADPTSFAHTTKVVVDYFRETGHFPPVDLRWYAGFEHIAAPPLITVIMGTIYYFSNDINLAVRIFQPLAEALFFVSMFYLMKKEGYPTLNAFLGGMVYAFMPTIFNTYGSSTKMVALFLLPFAFYFTNQVLTKTNIKYIAYLSIIQGLIILAHPMTGAVFAMFLCTYAVIYAVLDRQIVTRRLFFVMFGVLLGFLLAGEYVIPFFLQKVNRTAIAIEEASYFLVNFQTIYNDFKVQVGGAIFLFVPIYVIWRDKSAKLTAIYIMGLLSATIFFGYYFKIGLFFPFSLSYGYIWFFMTGFAFGYLIGLTVPWGKLYDLATYFLRVTLAIVIAVIYIYSANNYINFQGLRNTPDESYATDFEVVQALNKISNNGRVYPTHYPFGMMNWNFFRSTDKVSIEGHYFGISKIGKNIATMADAIHINYPQYVINKLNDLNVRYILANAVLGGLRLKDSNRPDGREIYVGQEFLKKLPENGYKMIYQSGAVNFQGDWLYRIYYLDKPSTYLMPIEDKTFVISRYASTFAAAISPSGIKALESGSEYFDDYDLEFLKNFDTVVLYGFGVRDKTKAENLAKEYVKQGGNLVVELYNMETSPLAGNPDFLGVNTYPLKMKTPADLEVLNPDKNLNNVPNKFNFYGDVVDIGNGTLSLIPFKEWNILQYLNLDESLVKLKDQEDILSVLGTKNIDDEGHKVTFVGMNFFYHLYLSHDDNEMKFVKSIIQNPEKDTRNTLKTPEIKELAWTPENSKFEIHADNAQPYLLSLAYSPHWRAYLDGKSVKIFNIEDLIAMNLPAGDHTLEVFYESTSISRLGWAVTVATGLFYIVFMIVIKRYDKKNQGKKGNYELQK